MAFAADKTRQGAAGAGGDYYEYNIEKSCRFENGSSAYMQRTPSSGGNRRVFTLSFWMKRGNIGETGIIFCATKDHNGAPSDSEFFAVRFDTDDKLYIAGYDTNFLATKMRFNDPSAWYHILIEGNTTAGSEYNRLKVAVNGVYLTSDEITTNYPAENFNYAVNDTIKHNISSRSGWLGDGYFDGLLAEVHYLDGSTAFDPSHFGEAGDYGDWKPIDTGDSSLVYGTNGFYLDFADSANLGNDVSGNNNDLTETNITASDQMVDSPTNNFATMNPLHTGSKGYPTFAEGNLKITKSGMFDTVSTLGMEDGGKYYMEMHVPTGKLYFFRLLDEAGSVYGAAYNQDFTITGTTTTLTGQITGISVDRVSDELKIYVNNSLDTTVDISSAPSNSVLFLQTRYPWSSINETLEYFNFGQDSSFAGTKTAQGNGGTGEDFYYTPPSGFKSLRTSNLRQVVKPQEHFNTVLYTGNGTTGASAQTVPGVGFQPDFTWLKNREDSGPGHILTDIVRGAGKSLHINNNVAENTDSTAGHLSAWNSDGFVLYGGSRVNQNNEDHVSWNWKAGGSGSANTEGAINSIKTSANVAAGFSMITWTGNGTVGHGLNSAPEMIIVKGTDVVTSWWTWHKDFNNLTQGFVQVNEEAAEATNSLLWDDANPSTATTINANTAYIENATDDYLAYCFHSVDGFSKVGTYVGNGDGDDGTFVYTGFRPAWVMIKHRTEANGRWMLFDNKRQGYNNNNDELFANLSDAEVTTNNRIDLLSNGWKIYSPGSYVNTDGHDYLYLAFAESPFKYANAR